MHKTLHVSKLLTELLFDCQSDRQNLSLLEDIYNSYTKARAALALGVLGSIPGGIL